jgi:hypothetical protein
MPHLSASCSESTEIIGDWPSFQGAFVSSEEGRTRRTPDSFEFLRQQACLIRFCFNIRSLRVLSLGITDVAGSLFLLDNAIFERDKN